LNGLHHAGWNSYDNIALIREKVASTPVMAEIFPEMPRHLCGLLGAETRNVPPQRELAGGALREGGMEGRGLKIEIRKIRIEE